ncbi:MAG: hypothetical protein MUO58_19690 [Anaerolineales bacterium]|nr:hypothetical protein [Anaerolineales bacterium]
MVAIHGLVLTGIYETELQTAHTLPELDSTASERITHCIPLQETLIDRLQSNCDLRRESAVIVVACPGVQSRVSQS